MTMSRPNMLSVLQDFHATESRSYLSHSFSLYGQATIESVCIRDIRSTPFASRAQLSLRVFFIKKDPF